MVDVINELEALKAELAAERATRLAAEAKVSSIDALIASLKPQIEKLRRELYGQRSEGKLVFPTPIFFVSVSMPSSTSGCVWTSDL